MENPNVSQPHRPPAERPPWWLALAGPTASGKSAASMLLAQHLPVEIVSVDSALVYRGMDIGTAKPDAIERGRVPHHLIDIRDPLQAYSAAEFARDARTLVRAINERGRLALLVGGTMLYFKALVDGLDDMPAADAGVRAALEHEAAAAGWPAMHAQLARIDPPTAARLAPNDSQRITRALEVYRISGTPLSVFHAQSGAARGLSTAQLAPLPMVSLEPLDRGWLHQRIADRFDQMLADGLLAEVRRLRARGDLSADLPSMRCVGYRQAWQALDEDWPAAQLRDRAIVATRQLAKRQLTWLRSMPARHVLACDDPQMHELLLPLCLRLAGERP